MFSIIIFFFALTAPAFGQMKPKARVVAPRSGDGFGNTKSVFPPDPNLIESLIQSEDPTAIRDYYFPRPVCWIFPLALDATPAAAFAASHGRFGVSAGGGKGRTKSPAIFAPVLFEAEKGQSSADYGLMLRRRKWHLGGRVGLSRDRSKSKAKRDVVTYKSTGTADIPSAQFRVARRFGDKTWFGIGPYWKKAFSFDENTVDFGGRNSSNRVSSRRDIAGFATGLEYQTRPLHLGVEVSMSFDSHEPSRETRVPFRYGFENGYFLSGNIKYRQFEDKMNSEDTTAVTYGLGIGRQFSRSGVEFSASQTGGRTSSDAGIGLSKDLGFEFRYGWGGASGARVAGEMSYQLSQSKSARLVQNRHEFYTLGVVVSHVR